MPFQGRSRDTIRDQYLADWQSEYAARSRVLYIPVGSDAWMQAQAAAQMQELVEAQAEQNARDILPDQASTEALNRFGYVYSVDRRSATSAQYTVTITGSNGTYSLSNARMTYADGTVYNVTSTSVLVSGGTGTISVTAAIAGEAGNRNPGDVLTWTSAPSGINPTGTVASEVIPGADAESDASYADRIIDLLRERPSSGNRADWRDWVLRFEGLSTADAFVYPLLQPPSSPPGAGTPDTLGCVTVVALGPVQGNDPVNSRIIGGVPGAALAGPKAYIEGTVDIEGNPVSDGTQLRAVTMSPTDYVIEAANVSTSNVTMAVTVNASNAYQWSGTMAVQGSSTTTSLVVSGDRRGNNGFRALVFVGTTAARGGYQLVTLGTGTYDGTNTTFPQTGSNQLLAIPSGTVYPASANYAAIRNAVFTLIDTLTPGDTAPPCRWPEENSSISPALSQLVPSRIIAAVQDVIGVVSVNLTVPNTTLTPLPKAIITLDVLTVTP